MKVSPGHVMNMKFFGTDSLCTSFSIIDGPKSPLCVGREYMRERGEERECSYHKDQIDTHLGVGLVEELDVLSKAGGDALTVMVHVHY